MSDKIKDTEKMNENREITAEDLDGVAGGKASVNKKIPYHLIGNSIDRRMLLMYGGRDIYRPKPKPLTPEEQKKLEEERKNKELEEK